jgi:hypothetical protein
MLVGVHVAHRHQRAVLGRQRGGVVRQRLHPVFVADFGQQLAQIRVARELEGHVADEVRQLVAGVQALEVRRAVDVVVGVDQPVRVEHHDGVHPKLAAAPADLDVAVDGVAPRAPARPSSSLRYIEGTWVILAARASLPMIGLQVVRCPA